VGFLLNNRMIMTQ